jgi:hypothetical protein
VIEKFVEKRHQELARNKLVALKNIAAESQCVCSKKDDEEWVDPNLSRRGSYTKSSSVKIEKGCTTTKTLDSPTHSKVSSISNEIDSYDLSRRGDNNVLESDEGEAPSRPIKNVERLNVLDHPHTLYFVKKRDPSWQLLIRILVLSH